MWIEIDVFIRKFLKQIEYLKCEYLKFYKVDWNQCEYSKFYKVDCVGPIYNSNIIYNIWIFTVVQQLVV